MNFKSFVDKTPSQLDPRKSAPRCFLVAPTPRARKSASYDKTVYRLEQVAHKLVGRVLGINREDNEDTYDSPDLDGPILLRLLQDDPEDAKRMLANYMLALLGEQDLAVLLKERCESL